MDPSDKQNGASEIEEEMKSPLDGSENNQNNEELFKHLSYLSQLNNDVSKH